MLKRLGIVLLVVLILVGALMPLKYTARMQLPRQRRDAAVPRPTARPDRDAPGRED